MNYAGGSLLYYLNLCDKRSKKIAKVLYLFFLQVTCFKSSINVEKLKPIKSVNVQ